MIQISRRYFHNNGKELFYLSAMFNIRTFKSVSIQIQIQFVPTNKISLNHCFKRKIC